MAKKIMRAFKIAEISAVDRPAQAGARMTIIKHHGADMPQFGKAAEAEWDAALSAYAKRNGLSVSDATLEFANTIEARAIYKRGRLTPRFDAMAKAAAIGNVLAEELAKAAFPDLSPVAAMNAWLRTEPGCTFYADDVAARTAARRGVA
ncbi:hypothetical protein [Bradyrhizobium sp. JYMT SZCCT0428]|uniref:hypothetical protein n=1 Tax=Bradyrhizobium sp. JYMT SZCCT0428 TaxID=2807673 RepID=UPI001BA598FB|nr:hypothetical protein [Bradyrhizobium sp. JYMT SZCCT0428]MBR1156672.1 hypothetical protein [Bradyrhizobium sp. JYMT SZCCT0428]